MLSTVAETFQMRADHARIDRPLARMAVQAQVRRGTVMPTMDDDMRKERLGFAIRAAMRAAGLTQEELAAAIGKSTTTVGRWVRGDTVPNVLEVGPLAHALRVSPLLFIEPPDMPEYPLHEYQVREATEQGQARGVAEQPRRDRRKPGAEGSGA